MKKIMFLVCVIMVAALFMQSNFCFADRYLVDRLYSSGPVVDSDSSGSGKGSGGSDADDEAPKVDPFMAERQVALKGAGSSAASAKSTDSASVDIKKVDINSGSDKSDSEQQDDKKSASSGNAAKQPSMHYYQ